jgi:two-component system, NarL family, response regulator DevR
MSVAGDPAPAPADAIRILVVDDHTIVRQGLRSILDLETGLCVVGEAGTVDQALTLAGRLRPDVVLLDVKLSDTEPAEGLAACSQLRARHPQLRIVVLTTFLDQSLLLDALHRGASAYVLKDVDAQELTRIIRRVHRGDPAFDGHSAQLMVRSLTGDRPDPPRLSPRETQVVRLVARGATNSQVAKQVLISPSTVKYHLRVAMTKLGAKDRTELVFLASKLGLL